MTDAASPASERILIVDDDADILVAARLLLKRHFAVVATASRPEQIPPLLAEAPFDVVLLDMNFGVGERSGREGLHWLGKILELDRDTVVILITAYSAVETAVEAIKLGASDFLSKPWQNEKLVAAVRAGVELRRSRRLAQQQWQPPASREPAAPLPATGEDMLGSSPAMRQVLEVIGKAAPTDANVLILGENGTGKELVARQLHRLSARRDQIFLSVDLGAVTESLIESELFGHKKGAFTGASGDRVGRFQAASGGTLFLDELGNLPRHLQGKLLTALERREVVPVGANAPVPIDVRVISATNVPRADLGDDSVFRQDLLYRLNTVEVELPPLRERGDDIALLAEHFLALYARKYGRDKPRFSDEARAKLARYGWPGNVRALRHAIERAVILCGGDTLRASDFALAPIDERSLAGAAAGAGAANASSGGEEPTTLVELERRAIAAALERHGGNVTHAAADLGITRTSLYRRMEKHGLS
jgi:DNA-binding NtrC family response regulator